MLNLREVEGGVLIPLRVKPRAGKNAVEGEREGALMVSVRAGPAEGEANAAVLVALADALGCAKSQLSIARGHKGREKSVLALGFSAELVRERLGLKH